MLPNGALYKRQIWSDLSTKTTDSITQHCTPFSLPSNGVLSFDGSTIKLTTNVIFQPECTGAPVNGVSTIGPPRDPFYASTIPQTYVIAAATVIAWILVVMLIITPRTTFFGQTGTAPSFSNGHGIIGGATGGGTNLIGVGSRPWLQKVAALTVAISLTIATGDTFRAAQKQYASGYMDATALRDDVLGSLEIRITRVISDIFLWLAQVQTLIRLFPRHKEKVLIKWIGFALILFDTIFSCLNNFMINTTSTPRDFRDAIPALSYLFELALGLLYAAWVIYYSLTKRRYAFYHPKMPSVMLIAALSLIAVLTPVVFFVTDVSNQDVAGWGDYFRWVGAAAASVVVWEWVERIEALERDEKKDGILGREIFDGDEMLDVTPSEEVVWAHARHQRNRYKKDDRGGGDSGGGNNQSSALEQGFSNVAQTFFRHRHERTQEHFPLGRAHSHLTNSTPEPAQATTNNTTIAFGNLPRPRNQRVEHVIGGPTPPPAVASPVSRADTTSAASTVYVVQYHPTADIPQPVRRRIDANGNTQAERAQAQAQSQQRSMENSRQNVVTTDPEKEEPDENLQPNINRGHGAWLSVSNPFKRKRASPPAEVQQARQANAEVPPRAATPSHNFSRWDVKNRLGVLAAETTDRFRDRSARNRQHDDLPVMIIPAQPRGTRAWTPPTTQQLDEAQASGGAGGASSNDSSPSHGASQPANASSAATAVTSSGGSRPSQRLSNPPRSTNASPLGAGGTDSPPIIIPAPSRNSNRPPPRADDIRPSASNSPTIIPAPRRSARSSPLATYHTAASSSRDGGENGNG